MRLIGLILIGIMLAALALSPAVCADASSDLCAHLCCTGVQRPRGFRRRLAALVRMLGGLVESLLSPGSTPFRWGTLLHTPSPSLATLAVATSALRI